MRPPKSIEVLSSELSLNEESPSLVASGTTTPMMMVVVVVVFVVTSPQPEGRQLE
jgi:hypothetical protein